LFLLSKIANSGYASKEELNELKQFADKATNYCTPMKAAKLGIKYQPYSPMVLNKEVPILQGFLIMSTLEFAINTNNKFKKVDEYFLNVEASIKGNC